jgi:ribosomal protein S18 acetylase RimI-like enzyme
MVVQTEFRIERDVTQAELPPAWSAIARAAGGGDESPVPVGLRALIAVSGREPVARLAYDSGTGFAGAPGTTGYVGWYAAAAADAGAALLRLAAEDLFDEGADRVVGPLNGSTWARYRVALPREAEVVDGEPFLGEPVNPDGDAAHFERAGYTPHLEYESRIVRAPRADAALAPAAARLSERGVVIRGIDLTRFDAELRAIHELSLLAFAENPYFTPVDFAEFAAMYAAVRPLVDPALVRLAVGPAGQMLGYVFAYVDPLPADRPRIVLKTLAAHPAARGLGLGRLLTDAVHQAAAERGMPVIHALMQASNFSKNISGRSDSEPFRRYRLFAAARP